MRPDRVTLGLAAFAAGYNARVGRLTALDVAQLEAVAETLVPRTDPLAIAVTIFAASYQGHHHNSAALEQDGVTLLDAVHRAMRSDPVDAHRRDIHG